MKKGIIMEMNERFLTLLTPEGEFLRARKLGLHYEIGQEIDFFPVSLDETKKSSFFSIFNTFKGKTIAAVALAFMLAFVSFMPFYENNEVYAYMSIDINPSLELGVNDKLQVINLIPYNDSGKLVVDELDNNWKKKDLEAVTEQIIQVIKLKGFLRDNDNIVISTVHTGKKAKKTEAKLEETIKSLKADAEKEHAVITTLEATESDREKAKEQGMTAGKYIEVKQNTSKQQIPDKKEEIEKEKTSPTKKQEIKQTPVKNNKGQETSNNKKKKAEEIVREKKKAINEKKSENAKDKRKETPPGLEKKVNQKIITPPGLEKRNNAISKNSEKKNNKTERKNEKIVGNNIKGKFPEKVIKDREIKQYQKELKKQINKQIQKQKQNKKDEKSGK